MCPSLVSGMMARPCPMTWLLFGSCMPWQNKFLSSYFTSRQGERNNVTEQQSYERNNELEQTRVRLKELNFLPGFPRTCKPGLAVPPAYLNSPTSKVYRFPDRFIYRNHNLPIEPTWSRTSPRAKPT
jgi:hypothetical protein